MNHIYIVYSNLGNMEATSEQLQTQQKIFQSTFIKATQLYRFDNQFRKEINEQALIINELIKDQSEIINKINSLKEVCQTIKRSIEIEGRNQNQSIKNHENNHLNAGNHENMMMETMPLFYKSIKKLESSDESTYRQVANKLKIMVSKVCSERNVPTHQNYVQSLVSDLKEEKILRDMNPQKMKIRNDILLEIKKKFRVSTLKEINYYRLHPSPYSTFKYHNYHIIFYVNLYNEGLLFYQQEPLPWNNALLYCPIVVENDINQGLVGVADQYYSDLSQENHLWIDYTLSILIQIQTNVRFDESKKKSIYVSSCSVNSLGKKVNEKPLCCELRKIRGYVYMEMVIKWLTFVLEPEKYGNGFCPHQIYINLDKSTKVLLTTSKVSQQKCFSQSCQIIEKPKIIQDFLGYFSEVNIKKRNQKNQNQVRNNLQTYLKILVSNINIQNQSKVKDQKLGQQQKINCKEFSGSCKYIYTRNGMKVKL